MLGFAAMFVVGGVIAAGFFLWPKLMDGRTANADSNTGGASKEPFLIAKNPDGTAVGGDAPVVTETIVPVEPESDDPAENEKVAPAPKEKAVVVNPDTPGAKIPDKQEDGEGLVAPDTPEPSTFPADSRVEPEPVKHAEAKAALETFLTAGGIEERLQYVHSPDKVEKAMEEYYGRHPQGLEPTRVEFQLANKLRDSQKQFFVFEVTTKQQTAPFPVSVEETEKGYKLDWRLFIEFHDNLLGQYLKIFQQDPDQFRVMLERAHYFRNDVPDLGNKLCFRIRPPMVGHEGYAFVVADSALGKELEDKFDWDVLYMPIVELKWVSVDGWKYIEVTKIIQDNWRTSF